MNSSSNINTVLTEGSEAKLLPTNNSKKLKLTNGKPKEAAAGAATEAPATKPDVDNYFQAKIYESFLKLCQKRKGKSYTND